MDYDPMVLRAQADKLYDRARFLVYIHAFGGFLLGLFLALSLTAVISHNLQIDPNFQMSGFVAILCAVIGAFHGHVKAGELRLEAQRLLCQHQTERNTRLAHATR